MWELQSQFRVQAEMAARGIFRELDAELRPRITLIGLLQSHRTDRLPICIEPEDGDYGLKDFKLLLQVHDRLGRLIVANAYAKGRGELQKHHEQLRNELLENAARLAALRGNVLFCSRPTVLDQYLVFVLIELRREAYESHFRLKRDRDDSEYVNSGADLRESQVNGVTGALSLIDAAVDVFLDEITSLLARSDQGERQHTFRTPGELLREAGRRLIGLSFASRHRDLFQSCATITSLKYEGEEGTGQIIVAPADHPDVHVEVAFKSPIPLAHHRAVRKLLQLSTDGLSLISDGDKVLGLGSVVCVPSRSSAELFVLRFTQLHIWEFCYYDRILMRVRFGEPALPRNQFDPRKFEDDLQRVFVDLTTETARDLAMLASTAVSCRSGAMLVISSVAEREAKRLEKQCLRIEPTRLNSVVLSTATEIDGAILLDTEGVCHAIGVILDGQASQFGTSARGARFNSAVRYVDSMEDPCMVVVISEDGSVDVIPDLLPEDQVGYIETAFQELQEVTKSRRVDLNRFYALMDWFDAHRSYLLPETCEALNSIQIEIERCLPPDTIIVRYAEFVSEGKLH